MGSEGALEMPSSPCASDCSEIRAEQTWREGGESLAKSKISEKTIVEKEQQLREYIRQNYSRIKGVENELNTMQRELRLADGPKRSALEMLRKKIEVQNEQVVAARARHRAARRFLASTEEELQTAEAVKEQLCSELNLVVQHSARAQLDKLEQLTDRLEKLAHANPPHNGNLDKEDCMHNAKASSSNRISSHNMPPRPSSATFETSPKLGAVRANGGLSTLQAKDSMINGGKMKRCSSNVEVRGFDL
ncbi:hypothetical protein BSKO_12709 [Bryopsis sp. KO-2023]|nr:hypothetical protein BSKO_12709 [Bryopsis sp. KO-2023]